MIPELRRLLVIMARSWDGHCARSTEKTAESRSKPFIGCLNTPICGNGKRFLCSKSCFGLLLGHWFRATVGPGMAGKGGNRGSTRREKKSTRGILCDTIPKTGCRYNKMVSLGAPKAKNSSSWSSFPGNVHTAVTSIWVGRNGLSHDFPILLQK